MNTLDGTGQKNNFTETYEAYVNDIYRLCFSFMKNHMDAEDSHSEIDGMMSLILELPYQYKMVVYLYYYEGYNSREIADLLHKSESTIRTRLQKAKKLLRKDLEKDGY